MNANQQLTPFRNDILRKHGVIPEKPPSPTPIIQEALLEAKKQAHENRLEGKDLQELDELEDEEDEAFLDHYRSATYHKSQKEIPLKLVGSSGWRSCQIDQGLACTIKSIRSKSQNTLETSPKPRVKHMSLYTSLPHSARTQNLACLVNVGESSL